MEEIDRFVKNSKNAIDKLKQDLKTLRTNRVSSALVENLMIETYDGTARLKLLELATIYNEGSQILTITPFDSSTLPDIEKGLFKSPLGVSPVVQGNKIILKFPPLTQEQREKLIKLVGQIVEETKKNIRDLRDIARKGIKFSFENKNIGEDEKFRLEKVIDEKTQAIMNEISNIKENKEKEIMEI